MGGNLGPSFNVSLAGLAADFFESFVSTFSFS
jgi:hypothetical protein